MTALAPYYIESSQANGNATLPASGSLSSTCSAQAGDLCVIVYMGQQSSGTLTAPTAVSSTFTADKTQAAGSNGNGRAVVYSTVLQSGDLSSTISANNATFSTTFRAVMFLFRPSGTNTFTSARVAETFSSTSNVSNGTLFSWTVNPTTPCCVIDVYARDGGASAAAQTIKYDGGTARDPYVDESGSTTTSPAHGSHYGCSSNFMCADYQEYDSSDTPGSVAWQAGMANTTHAVVGVLYKLTQAFSITTATETDTAQALGHKRTYLLGTATETDTARSVGRQLVPLTKATETDTAQALGVTKTLWHEVNIQQPTSSQQITTASLTAAYNYPDDAGEVRIVLKQNGTQVQASAWTTLTATPTLLTLTLSTPARGTGFTIRWEARYSTGQLTPLISDVHADGNYFISTATETDTAGPLGTAGHRIFTIGTATETDTALHLAVRSRALGKLIRFNEDTLIEHDEQQTVRANDGHTIKGDSR